MGNTIIYRDTQANAVFIQDSNGAQFLNSLQAINAGNDYLTIIDLSKSIEIITYILYSDIIDKNGFNYGTDGQTTVNALNAIFQATGSSQGELPLIISATSINAVEGDIINYELLADYGVGYEWGNLPSGLLTVEGNVRKLIGSLAAGAYTLTMKAVNYFGEDTKTLTINVANPPFSNTKSIAFQTFDHLNATPTALSGVLGRTGNGSGASDAWSIAMWQKGGTYTGSLKQTLFFFGDTDYSNGGHIWLYYKGNEQALYLEYGSKNNYLKFKTNNSTLSNTAWTHVLVTYDGGTTGSSSGNINNYYSRFKIFLNGVQVSTSNSNNNYGWSASIDSDLLYIGKRPSNDYMRNNAKLDEIAVFNSDQSANVSDIYNGGVPFDLSTLANSPVNWWRMGDGDTYPVLADSIGSTDFTMVNMTAANIVNDTP